MYLLKYIIDPFMQFNEVLISRDSVTRFFSVGFCIKKIASPDPIRGFLVQFEFFSFIRGDFFCIQNVSLAVYDTYSA